MDIQENQHQNYQNPPIQSPNKPNHIIRHNSINSRISLDSMNSGWQPKNCQQRPSFESNITQKQKERLRNLSLFDSLIEHDHSKINYVETNREATGSNPPRYTLRNSDENLYFQDSNRNEMDIEPSQIITNNNAQTNFIKITCKCEKSKCLLMYCQCFSKGLVCNNQCSCNQCRNNSQFEEKRLKARQLVLQRDPTAFTNKLELIGGQQTQLAHKRGCNCKKTHCFKKYCQCFHAGVKCTYLCHCQGCLNGGQNAYKQ